MADSAFKAPCRYFGTQRGCRFGENCRFSHDPTLASEKRSPSQPHRIVPSSFTPATPKTRSGASGNSAPRSFCNFYWNTGQCSRGFDCTFRHQKNSNPQSGSTNATGGVEEERAANAALEFFSMGNLTQMAGVGLHSAQEGTPENAHNSIKRYLGGGPLASPIDIKPLASILASVNRRNRAWVRKAPHSRRWMLTISQTVFKAQVTRSCAYHNKDFC